MCVRLQSLKLRVVDICYVDIHPLPYPLWAQRCYCSILSAGAYLLHAHLLLFVPLKRCCSAPIATNLQWQSRYSIVVYRLEARDYSSCFRRQICVLTAIFLFYIMLEMSEASLGQCRWQMRPTVRPSVNNVWPASWSISQTVGTLLRACVCPAVFWGETDR